MKRLATNLLRLLIGIGFTFSLAVGATLTLLTLCDGSGNNLTLSRTGPHWEWFGCGLAAWGFALFCWYCWRRLPATKPTRMFPTLERWLQAPVFSIGGIAASLYLMLDMGLRLITHMAGASWMKFGFYALITVINSQWIVSAWKNRSARRIDANK